MNPVISVIIPVYNAENTIEKCVESLVLGRMRELEVILVEDCSADGSWALCQALERRFSQVRCVRNEKNRGVSSTRNRGLDMISGEFVCFVDSDDWVSEYYLAELLQAAKENPDALILCGLHFLNRVDEYRRTYLWSPEGERHELGRENFFALHEKFLLPQLWNKIFRRDVLEDHLLRFDENQNMGEDFQFVLDYMEAAGICRCMVVNQPLYFYTRNGKNTLMGSFGHSQRSYEFLRYAKLRDLTGEQMQYDQAFRRLKGNYVYHCLRHSKAPKAEQLAMIEEIAGDGQAAEYYRQLQITRAKEAVVLSVRAIRKKLAVTWGDFQRARNQRIVEKARTAISCLQEPVTILSQNCIGGILYKDMGTQFTSPTIGLFLQGSDFVRFVSNLEDYLSRELELRWGGEYPIGMLEDVEIHFMHYDTCRQAREAWERRCRRINRDRILVLCTDRDGFAEKDFELWKQIQYPKLLFTANQAYRSHPDSLYFQEFGKRGAVGELIPHRRFYRGGKLVQRIKAAK